MSLSKLYDVYTFETNCFYTEYEISLDKALNRTRKMLKDIKIKCGDSRCGRKCHRRYCKSLNSLIGLLKSKLKRELENNVNIVRQVSSDRLVDKNIVSIFDSHLTRSLKMSTEYLNTELVIIKVYYFSVAKSIIKNGFMMNGEKYIFFSASAGQIRQKKFVAVKESSLKECWNTLTCGLTLERINQLGGVNRNKYLAYLSLVSSATDVIPNREE